MSTAHSHFGVCPACRTDVAANDDFARLGGTLYHLACVLDELRALGRRMGSQLGDGSALPDGIDALGTRAA